MCFMILERAGFMIYRRGNNVQIHLFIYYLASARSGYSFSYEKERLSLFLERLHELATLIGTEKKLHHIREAVIQSDYVHVIDRSSYRKPTERPTFSADEKIQYIAKNTQLTLLSRITAMSDATEAVLKTL